MSILINGGTIITMDNDRIIDDGVVLIENNRIAFVGAKQKDVNLQADTVIDARGKYVLPGLINMHCHLFQVLLRTLGTDMGLFDWLEKVIWPVVGKIGYEDIYNAAYIAIAENIKSGVTTFVEMNYGNPHYKAILKAFGEIKIRGYLVRGFYEIESIPTLIEKKSEILKSLETMMEEYPNVMPGPMHPCNATNDLLLKTKELADRFDRNFCIHLAETEQDIDLLVKREGKRDAELLHSLNILDKKFIGVHSCNLNRNEMSYLSKAKSNTVHCPTTNMNMADGVSPISQLINEGVNVCIGTDGAASTGRLDMFSEMKTAALLQKVTFMDPSQISAKEILKMATVNGAKALGLESGILKNGCLADVVILDMHKLNTVFSSDPISAVVYSANTENVDTVIVDGNILLKEGQFTTLDIDEVLDRGYKTACQLLKK
jgi:5-methylthioadenosine/S-adenosylhomocysteine deaminase